MGPPDFLSIDQGSGYVSKEFRSKAEAAGIRLSEAPIENPGSIGIVERYHAPLRRAYQKIWKSLDRAEASDVECLKMAVYANNSTIGSEGLCPILLVYGALPRPARVTPSPSQVERQRVVEESRVEVQSEQAKRRVAFAIRHPCNNKNVENSNHLRKLPSGSPVMICRTTSDSWEGPINS